MLLITSMVGGKYRADPHPDRNAPPAAAPRGNVPAPKFRRQQQPVLPPGGMSFSGPPPTAVPGSGLILPGAPPVGAPVVGGVVGPVPGTTAQPLPTGNPPVVSGPVPQQYPE